MATTTDILDDLKKHFISGAQPTQAQFEKLIDTYLVNNNNKVGIGTEQPLNTLDVSGSVAIGSGHAGDEVAPPNGLIVEGSVGIGHNLADQPLHVNGNVRIDNGNLYMGQKLVINSDGEWTGVDIDTGNNDNNDNNSAAWSDGINTVSTDSHVGIGTNQPTSKLHVDGDTTIENGGLTVSGTITKKDIAFTAYGIREIVPATSLILLETTQNQHTPHIFWDTNTSIFKPDAAHAGTYCFMVSLTIQVADVSGDENPKGEEQKGAGAADGRIYFASGSDLAQLNEIMPIRESGSSLHASASLLLPMDGNSAIAIKTDNPALQIESISFSGYRI